MSKRFSRSPRTSTERLTVKQACTIPNDFFCRYGQRWAVPDWPDRQQAFCNNSPPLELVIDYNTQIKTFDALQLWVQIYELVRNEDKASCFRLTEDKKRYLEKHNTKFVKPMKGEYEVLDILEEQRCELYIIKFAEEWLKDKDVSNKIILKSFLLKYDKKQTLKLCIHTNYDVICHFLYKNWHYYIEGKINYR